MYTVEPVCCRYELNDSIKKISCSSNVIHVHMSIHRVDLITKKSVILKVEKKNVTYNCTIRTNRFSFEYKHQYPNMANINNMIHRNWYSN